MIPIGVDLRQYLELQRPLAMVDLETTGLFFQIDRVVQIGLTMHYPDTPPIRWQQRLNPGIPIPPEVTEIHGITDEMVADSPVFAQFADELAVMLSDIDYGGQNVDFDLKMLRREFRLLGKKWDWEKSDSLIIDSKRMDEILFQRNLGAMYKRHRGHELEGAHDASVDVNATEEIIESMLINNPSIPRRIPELSAYCFPLRKNNVDSAGKFVWRYRVPVFAFGKHISKPAKEFPKYLEWMIELGDFSANTKEIARKILAGEEIAR